MADASQPGDPDEPEEQFPGLPGFLFGAGGGFDPSKIDLSQIDLNQFVRLLQSEGPVNWEIARQTAEAVALEGRADPTVDPKDRAEFEDLARAAQTLVAGETGLPATTATEVAVVGPKGWVDLHLVALRPVLEALAATLGETLRQASGGDDTEEDATASGGPFGPTGPGGFGITALGPVFAMLAPALLGMQAGSMIGYLAQHALGRYDLPLPTGPAPTDAQPGGDTPTLCFVGPNIDAFGDAWSLPRADLRFHLALHEVVHAAVRSVPWVRGLLVRLAIDYVSAYEIDDASVAAEFGALDPDDPSTFETMAQSPERILRAMQSERQNGPREALQRLTCVMEGYADVVIAGVGRRLIPTFDQIHEAMARHRVERGDAERFIEGLLGLKLERAHYDRGRAFCDGVIERAGVQALTRLWERDAMLPTLSELDAPGLWLARIELPS